jgi:electron transfer flavoprotein beta subunit
MHCVVCLKQVPDSAQIRVHPVTHTIMRQGVPSIVNPYDLFALEAALRLKDRFGGRVTAISMGPLQAEAVLRKALSFGADDAILLTDKAFAGADTLATSYALAAAIRRIGQERPVDLVFTGKQSIDGDTAQVGPGIARRLGLQLLSYVSRIVELDSGRRELMVERRAEGGVQVLKTRLPALVAMLEDSNAMRFGTLPDVLRAARQSIRHWNKTDAGVENPNRLGLKGSPTVVNKVFTPSARAAKAEMIVGDTAAGMAANLLARMQQRFPDLALAAPTDPA